MSHNPCSGHLTPTGTTCLRCVTMNEGRYFVPRRLEIFTTHANDIALTVVVPSRKSGLEETVVHINLSRENAAFLKDWLNKRVLLVEEDEDDPFRDE